MRQVYEHYARGEAEADGLRFCPRCAGPLESREDGGRLRPACPACGFVEYRNPAPAVCALVIDGERALIGRRSGQPGQGTWALPSGYVEYDEDYVTAARREVKEETGLDVEICTILNVTSSFVSPRFHFFSVHLLARVVGGELAPADDLLDVGWYPVAGPLPPLGFAEDADTIAAYAGGWRGLPIRPGDAAAGSAGRVEPAFSGA